MTKKRRNTSNGKPKRIKVDSSMQLGLAPGTIVYVGDRKVDEVKVTMVRFGANEWHEDAVNLDADCPFPQDETELIWMNMEGMHDVRAIERVGTWFGLHPLEMEDIANTMQRPKREILDNHIFLIVRVFGIDPSHPLYNEQLSLIVTKQCVVTFQEGGSGNVFKPLKERMKASMSRYRKLGSDYLAYSILDAVVDQYFVVLEELDERIDGMEESLLQVLDDDVLNRIHFQRHELVSFRRAIWPVREIVSELERGGEPIIGDDTRIYLRDLHDHLIQIMDSVESLRDVLSGMIEIYLSSVSNRLNRVMKFLTVISTIFIPLTFIVGVYGMNFPNMPEMEWRYGYGLTWMVMLGIALAMLIMFRRKKWL